MAGNNFVILTILITTLVTPNSGATLLNWIWGKPADDTTVLVADGVPLISIPYETMTEDEKFLQEAAKFTEIQVSSPLETCQHKVVMRIRTSCSDMSEEELAKLSVNLLNCQSAVEGRKMFPCTEEMSLKQCTTDMDADMWNAYHLMSNRARAVCYASRSTQFRALTELTVNKLMQSAHSQIKALNTLKENQEQLGQQTLEALFSITEGNKALLHQQENLRDAQISAHQLVTNNLRELNNERALIRLGHTQLASMTEDIKNKLERASKDIMEQAYERSENHKELLEDLTNLQLQAQLIWDKIEASTEKIVAQNEEAAIHYEETLQKLAQINDTIQFIWNITNTMRSEVDEKLGWITNYIGDTGQTFQQIYRTSLHVIYLLAAMVVAAFLHAPFLTRVTILGIVPLNLISYLKQGMEACLDFPSITTLIILITLMHYVMVGIQYLFSPKKQTFAPQTVNGSLKNGVATNYTSDAPKNQQKGFLRFFTRLSNTIQHIYRLVRYEWTNRCIDKVGTILQSLRSWNRTNVLPTEKLSCSYTAANLHEDICNDVSKNYYAANYSISDDEDLQRNNHSEIQEEAHDTFDWADLRQRYPTRETSVRRNSSRSVSPSLSSSPRMQCIALTRHGKKCKMYAMNGHNYCNRHNNGNSIAGD